MGIIVFWGVVNLIAESSGPSPVLEFINNVLIPFIIGIAFLALPIGIIYGIYANSKHYDGTIKCGNCSYVGPGKSGRSTWAQVTVWILFFFSPLITIIYYLVTHKYVCPKCDSTFIGLRDVNGHFSAAKSGMGPLGIVLLVFLFISIIGILAAVVLASLNDAREAGLEAANNSIAPTTLNQELIEAEKGLNSLFNLPAMLDEETRLDRIYASTDNKMNYKYTLVNYKSSEIIWADFKNEIEPSLEEFYCDDSTSEYYRDKDVPMRWSYHDMDNKVIGFIELSNKDCI